jgi:hypothetical protein
MGNFLDVGRTSTPNTNTLGQMVWTSYAASTWFQYRPSSSAFKILTKNWSMGVIYGLAL